MADDDEKFAIPEIDPLVPLIIDGDRVRLALPPQAPEDLAIIDILKPELLDVLEMRLADYEGSNRFQAPHFTPGLTAYKALLARPSNEIPIPLLFTRGMKIIRDFDAAITQLERGDTEWEPFKPEEESELRSIIDIHSQIMSRTREGQASVVAAMDQETSPEQKREQADALDKLITTVVDRGDVTTPETGEVLQEIADTPAEGVRASQTMTFKYAAAISIGALLLAGPAAVVGWGVATLAGSTAVGGVAAAGAAAATALLAGETIKQNELFKEVRDDLGVKLKAVTTATENAADGAQQKLFDAFKAIREQKAELLQIISTFRPEFRWMGKGSTDKATVPLVVLCDDNEWVEKILHHLNSIENAPTRNLSLNTCRDWHSFGKVAAGFKDRAVYVIFINDEAVRNVFLMTDSLATLPLDYSGNAPVGFINYLEKMGIKRQTIFISNLPPPRPKPGEPFVKTFSTTDKVMDVAIELAAKVKSAALSSD